MRFRAVARAYIIEMNVHVPGDEEMPSWVERLRGVVAVTRWD
jgi:hypothetical protein